MGLFIVKKTLTVSVGQSSTAGKKDINQDFHGIYIPEDSQLNTKGIAFAVADGISSSEVSQIASETSVKNFLADYYSTSDAWSVKKSALKVLTAINYWLYAQSQNGAMRYDKDKGYICTFSGAVLKSNTAHIFHSGDSQIQLLSSGSLETLTTEHRRHVSKQTSYLTQAFGVHQLLDIDYKEVPIKQGDILILTTDGVHEFLTDKDFISAIEACSDLNQAANTLIQQALDSGSDDNLTLQLVRIDELPDPNLTEVHQQVEQLLPTPSLDARMEFDGFYIERDIYMSSRSHVYLAKDIVSQQQVVLKVPSTEMRTNQEHLENMLMEDWIAKKLNNPHILKALSFNRPNKYLYTVTEFVEGQTLTQWMIDNPTPSLEQVRNIVVQVAKGLQAFHRLEMVHQDLRPENIMISPNGCVKIIDFGATKVAGIDELKPMNQGIVGTMQYTAPEYFTNFEGNSRSDIFALGVITYQMLCGKLPYGTGVSKANTRKKQQALRYQSLSELNQTVPLWIDLAIRKAVEVDPTKRYYEVSEFAHELTHPNPKYLNRDRAPLIERDPLTFWKSTSTVLLVIVIYLLFSK